MLVKEGQKLLVKDRRTGTYKAIANGDFDTEKDEWYDIILDQDELEGLTVDWFKNDHVPARRGITTIEIREG